MRKALFTSRGLLPPYKAGRGGEAAAWDGEASTGEGRAEASTGTAHTRLSMESPGPGPGLVERLAQLATCPLCGGPFEDPVLLACEHSFCRACLARRWGAPPAPGPEAPPTCPRCGQPCPRRSLRSHVRLAVEVRISRGLRERLAEPGARARRRRGGRIPTMGSLDPPGEVRGRWSGGRRKAGGAGRLSRGEGGDAGGARGSLGR